MKAVQCPIHGLQFGHSFYSDLCNSCCTIDIVEVKLYEPSSVGAVNKALKLLPVVGAVIMEYGGKFYVEDGFIAFACENQGYVKEVLR